VGLSSSAELQASGSRRHGTAARQRPVVRPGPPLQGHGNSRSSRSMRWPRSPSVVIRSSPFWDQVAAQCQTGVTLCSTTTSGCFLPEPLQMNHRVVDLLRSPARHAKSLPVTIPLLGLTLCRSMPRHNGLGCVPVIIAAQRPGKMRPCDGRARLRPSSRRVRLRGDGRPRSGANRGRTATARRAAPGGTRPREGVWRRPGHRAPGCQRAGRAWPGPRPSRARDLRYAANAELTGSV